MNAQSHPSLFSFHRLVITGELEVKSPLMLGSGERAVEPDLKVGDDDVLASQIVEDHNHKPYLPGSSLKGLMRSLGARDAAALKLFGQPHEIRKNVGMALLTVYGAEFLSTPKYSHVPHYDENKGSGIEAHTAIDGERGVAEKKKLFHERHVPKGARFSFRAEIVLSGNQAAEQLLGKVLGSMMNGFNLGRGVSSGQGKMVLHAPTLSLEGIDKSGLWGPVTAHHAVIVDRQANLGKNGKTITIKLECDGPYIVKDASWEKKYKQLPKEQRKKLSSVRALGMAENVVPEAILPGSSLRGVLKGRSAWVEAVNGNSAARLTTLLFGDTEKAALLRIITIESSHSGESNLPSVKLDRFSGAPFEKALYACRCFVSPMFKIVLELHDDQLQNDEKAKLEAHLDFLWRDLRDNGLIVGQGGNRGFGWCKVEVTP